MTTSRDVETIVKAHQAGIWRYLRYLGCDRDTADDLTQEAFTIVLASHFVDRLPAQTAAFLRTTARNLFMTHVRRTARIESLADLDNADLAWGGTRNDEDGGEGRLAALRHCLETLGERERRAVDLSFGQSRRGEDAARALGESHDNLRVILHRAKQTLRKCIERKVKTT